MSTNNKTLISELTPATLEKNGIAYAPRTLASLVYMDDGSNVSDTLEDIISDGKRFILKTKTEISIVQFDNQRVYEIPTPINNYDFNKFPVVVLLNNTLIEPNNYNINNNQLVLSETVSSKIKINDNIMFIFHYLDIIVEDRGIDAEFVNNVRFYVDEREPRHKQKTDVWFDTLLNQVKQFNGEEWDIIVSGSNTKGLSILKSTVRVESRTSSTEIGIDVYNSRRDLLFVYLNSTYLEEGQDYRIDEDNRIIHSLDEKWDGTKEAQIFNFVVFKNIPQALGTDKLSSAILKSSSTVDTVTNSVNIKINDYNTLTDSLFVYVNSTYLEEGQDYILDKDRKRIRSIDSNWDGRNEPQIFNFIVFKNVQEIKDTETVLSDTLSEGDYSNINELIDIVKSCQSTITSLEEKVKFLESKITKE